MSYELLKKLIIAYPQALLEDNGNDSPPLYLLHRSYRRAASKADVEDPTKKGGTYFEAWRKSIMFLEYDVTLCPGLKIERYGPPKTGTFRYDPRSAPLHAICQNRTGLPIILMETMCRLYPEWLMLAHIKIVPTLAVYLKC
jgi:hypothetical protein